MADTAADLPAIARFAAHFGVAGADFAALHRASIAEPERFWAAVWTFCGVRGEMGERVLENGAAMPGARWFTEARLNFAQNCLTQHGAGDAIVAWDETGRRGSLSHDALQALVARAAGALHAAGVGAGDRVAAMLPNIPETVAIMLACARVGAVFSSCSPDFGADGVLSRFAQIDPVVLFACDGYRYAGKTLPQAEKLRAIAAGLPGLARLVVLDLIGEGAPAGIPGAHDFAAFLATADGAPPPPFAQLPFAQPLVIAFSSGTTGAPKCIVHSAGGVLLKHLTEHRLHADIRPGDRVFYFSTCGWMMWNWHLSALASGATLILYDGSPFHAEPDILWRMAAAERVTQFGTSAKYIDTAAKRGIAPHGTHDLAALRMVLSTGSPLLPEGFDYIERAVKPGVHLASISGGTDILSCFLLGNPLLPVQRGEMQGPGLGLAVDVFGEDGAPLPVGQKGELVCTRPFPSMPLGFWNDADGSRYRAAYFARFPGVWHHGDYIEKTAAGGYIIHGRSDATLNPGGVRIGTAEIYAQVETLAEVREALVVGQDWEGDVRVVLFVVLAEGQQLTDELTARIKARIRDGTTPRHVPGRVIAVADIPRTKSGKITELAVREIIHGRAVKNAEALANPQALALYADLPELRT